MKRNINFFAVLFLLINYNNSFAQTGASLHFDGVNDYVSIPNRDILNPTKVTIEFWIKWENSATTVNFICAKNYEQLEIHTGGSISNSIRFIPTFNVYLDGPANILPTNVWTHVACIYDPSNAFAKLYVNGVEKPFINNGTFPITTPMINSASPFNIGRRASNSLFFKGQLDEFRIWDKVLAPCEIQNTMNCEASGVQNNLVAYYKFNQGMAGAVNSDVTSLMDASGNNLSGILTNFSVAGMTSNWVEPGSPSSAACGNTYVFVGDGKWSDSTNWSCLILPPDISQSNSEIVISPVDTGECILDIEQIIQSESKLIVQSGKKLRILGDLRSVQEEDSFTMTYDDVEFLDSITTTNPISIQLARPTSPARVLNSEGTKENLILSMLQYAQTLSAKKQNDLHPAGGSNQPAHYGLAYRYTKESEKDISKRLRPTEGDNLHRKDSVFGTDCTGLMLNLIRNAGINIGWASSETFAQILNVKLQNPINKIYKNIRVDSLGRKTRSQLKNGDFIVWTQKRHMGIIYIDGPEVKIFNSNGEPNPLNAQINKKNRSFPNWTAFQLDSAQKKDQEKNRGDKRGVHPISYDMAITSNYWNDNYIIFRLENVNPITSIPSSVTSTSALSGGNIQYTGVNEIIDKGICWGKKQHPKIIIDNSMSDASTSNSFTISVTGLTPNTDYYIRAYVTIKNNGQSTDKGITYYGNEEHFFTGNTAPQISTSLITYISPTSVTTGGTIASDGNLPITARGICWATSANPTIANNAIPDNDIQGNINFTSLIDGLASGPTYHVRAYATNALGTSYGNDVPFVQKDTFQYIANYRVPGTIVNNSITFRLHFSNGTITGRALIANYPLWGIVTGNVNGANMNLNLNYDNGVTPVCNFIQQPPPSCPSCQLQTFPGGSYGIKEDWVITGTTNSDHSTFVAIYNRNYTYRQIVGQDDCSFPIVTSYSGPENGTFTY